MMPQQKEAGTIRVQQLPKAVVHAHTNQHDPQASPPISRVRVFIGTTTILISGILFGSAITYNIRWVVSDGIKERLRYA